MHILSKRFARLALLLFAFGTLVFYCFLPGPPDPYKEWAKLRASRREIIGGPSHFDGIIMAQIVGPNHPTDETRVPDGRPNTIKYFWVTLKVVDVHNGFGQELKGKTIQLCTEEFRRELIGQILPLRLWFVAGGSGNGSIEYSLPCTSLSLSQLLAKSPAAATVE